MGAEVKVTEVFTVGYITGRFISRLQGITNTIHKKKKV